MDPNTTTLHDTTEGHVVAFLATALASLKHEGTLSLCVSNSYGRAYTPQWAFSSAKLPAGEIPTEYTLEALRVRVSTCEPKAVLERQIAECRQRLAELEGRAS